MGGENQLWPGVGSRCGNGTECAEWVTDQVLQGLDGLDDRGELAGSARTGGRVRRSPSLLAIGIGG